MGLFRMRSYFTLELPPWFELRMFDPRSNRTDLRAALQWIDLVQVIGRARLFRSGSADVERYLRPLLNVVLRIDPGSNRELLASAFAEGWTIADLERADGIEKAGRASGAAYAALALLRSSFGEDGSLPIANMLDAGYFANRTRMDPMKLVQHVVDGSGMPVNDDTVMSDRERLLAKWRLDQVERTKEQVERGQAWMAERRAEKERRRQEWLRGQDGHDAN